MLITNRNYLKPLPSHMNQNKWKLHGLFFSRGRLSRIELGTNWHRFKALTVVGTKMAVFCQVAPCSLTGVYRRSPHLFFQCDFQWRYYNKLYYWITLRGSFLPTLTIWKVFFCYSVTLQVSIKFLSYTYIILRDKGNYKCWIGNSYVWR
jgi:hypothetical protein